MSLYEKLDQWWVGGVTFPLTNWLMNRSGILSEYRLLRETETAPPERVRELQLRRLQAVVRHAYAHCPFYTERFREAGLTPADIRSPEDLAALPAVSRQDVIERAHDMVDRRWRDQVIAADRSTRGPGAPIPFARFKKNRLIRNTSSGSTGAPTVFYEDGATAAMNWAHELRLRKWFGVDPGAAEARLHRVSTEYMPRDRVLRMRARFWNQLLVPGVNLSEADYAEIGRKVTGFEAKVLWGFTSALTGFAEYVRAHPEILRHWRPKALISWAAPLYEHEERLLREVFDCGVTNIYGAREVGHIAMRCPENSLHINHENLLVQTDESTEGAGDARELLVTLLRPGPMPFIRYRMGDLGCVAESTCACGRTLPVIEQFLGRTGEIFITRDGRMISPNFWCRTFMNEERSRAIRRFQVIYTKEKDLRIRIVKGPEYTEAVENALRSYLRENFSADTGIAIEYPDVIEPQISGKYQMVVKE